MKIPVASEPALKGKNAKHMLLPLLNTIRVAVWPPTVEGLHGVAVGGVTVVLPALSVIDTTIKSGFFPSENSLS